MVFHIGALWRLDETGLLQNIKRISSVSGGSITAGQLALAWRTPQLQTGQRQERFHPQIRRAAARTSPASRSTPNPSFWAQLLPGSVGDRIAKGV